MIFNNGACKGSVRNILKNKLNTFIIVVSLTLGLAAAFIIFSWALYEYSYDQFQENKDRIYRVLDHQSFKGQEEQYLAQVPEYLVNTFEREIPGIELSTVLVDVGSLWIEHDQETIEVKNVCYSDSNLFNIFSFTFITGDPSTCFSSLDNVVLTEQTAKRLFGNEDPLGKTFKSDGDQVYVVGGVIKDIPVNSHLDFNMLLSIEKRKPYWEINNGDHNASIYVLLKKGIHAGDLKANLRKFTDAHFPWDNQDNYELQLQPLRDIHLNSGHTIWEMNKNKFNKTSVVVIVLMAFLLLFIASFNFLNLTLVRLSKRKTEIGIRKINGSARWQIINQFLLENVVLAGLAIVLAFLILVLLYPFINETFFSGYKFADIFNLRSIFICLGIVVMMVFITGLFPALTYTSLSSASVLSGFTAKTSGRRSFNHALVVSQLAVTTFLIIGTLGISKQMKYVRDADLGVKTAQVLILPSIQNIKKDYPVLKETLLKNPHILKVTASNRVFGQNFWRNSIKFEGQDPTSEYIVPYLITDFDFPEFYHMDIIKGRSFSREFKLDREGLGFLINESLAREMGYKNPVGKKMRLGHTNMGEIIGVVKDFHYQSMHKSIEPMAFYVGSDDLYEISVNVTPTDLSSTLAFIEKTWKSFRPNRPFRYRFLDQEFASHYNNDVKTTRLVLLFTILSIVLSSLGLFGLISFVSEQKTKEIGIRKVNGARIAEIMTMLNKSYVIWGAAGFVAACPVAWITIHKWLENFAYKTILSWWIFALAGLLALGIALLTVSWQSWRAATRNPVEALRYE